MHAALPASTPVSMPPFERLPQRTRAAAAADYAACRELLRAGSKSFFMASLMLPARLRDPVCALYAFCRLADDAVDEGEDRDTAFAWMRERLHAAYAGRPFDHPVDVAFAATVHAHGIPREIPEALFEGFEWDADGRRYATLSDLRAYAVRVAGTVGTMMALVMGVRDQRALARACDLGVAMQLTNIARDVGEDARNGRLYIPTGFLVDESIDVDAFMATPEFTPALGRCVERLLREADRLYANAESGIPALPADCRTAIWGARYIYAAIGNVVRHNGLNSLTTRAVVPRLHKLGLLLAACVSAVLPARRAALATALPEALGIIEATTRAAFIGATPLPKAARGGLDARFGGIFDILMRLEGMDRARTLNNATRITAL